MPFFHDDALIVECADIHRVVRLAGQGSMDGQYGLRLVLVTGGQAQEEEVWYPTAALRDTAYLTLRMLVGEGQADGIRPVPETGEDG